MNLIQQQTETRANVIQEGINILTPVMQKLQEKEREIGEQLSQALRKSRLEERGIGACPTCKEGKLIVMRSRKTGKRFVGCTGYFEGKCKTAFPLPQKGFVKPLGGKCGGCGWPTVRVWMKAKPAWNLCLNPECPIKENKSRGK